MQAVPTCLLSPCGRGRGPLRSNGRVRGKSPYATISIWSASPLTLPMLRMGPLPLPRGERALGEPTGGLLLGRGLAWGRHHGVGDEAGVAADGALDRIADRRVLLEEVLGVLAALADALAVIGEPRARFLDDAGIDAEIDELAALGDALAVHDVEFDDLEGR